MNLLVSDVKLPLYSRMVGDRTRWTRVAKDRTFHYLRMWFVPDKAGKSAVLNGTRT